MIQIMPSPDLTFADAVDMAFRFGCLDTRRLQHYLGHASITNTVIYTKMSPEPFKDIWRKR